MGNKLFICNAEGDVFEYVPSSVKSSEAEEAVTNYLFTAFNGVEDPVTAFACGRGVTAWEIPPVDISSSSSSNTETFLSESSGAFSNYIIYVDSESSELVSDEAQDAEEKAFYIARNISEKENVILSCYSMNGELLSEHTLPISEKLLGMEVWPKDGNRIIAISEKYVYSIDLSYNADTVAYADANVNLLRGISYKSGDGDSAEFWVAFAGEYGRICTMRIDKTTGENTITSIFPVRESKNGLGFANYLGRLHAAYKTTGETEKCRTIIKDYSNRKEFIIPVAGVDISSQVAACAYLMPYSEKYLKVETVEYDSETGMPTGNSEPSTFGAIASGSESGTKVVRLNVPWARKIENIRLGITNADLLGEYMPEMLKFGTTPEFIPLYQPEDSFQGINETDLYYDSKNKSVPVGRGGLNQNMSDYVYLSVSLPERYFGSGNFQLKWFFDFEVDEEVPLFIPAKECEEIVEAYSSESSVSSVSSISSSSDFLCQAGSTYRNLNPDPISFDGTVYSWSNGTHNLDIDGHADIGFRCHRVLIYDNVYHDGTTYILGQPYAILAPRKTGPSVPKEFPYVVPCWDYHKYKGKQNGSPIFKLGGNKTFEVNPQTLFESLIVKDKLQIRAGFKHTLALECDVYYLSKRKPYKYLVQGNVFITPRAYYHRGPGYENLLLTTSDSESSEEAQQADGPRIAFIPDRLAKMNVSYNYRFFNIVNTGNEPLVISKIEDTEDVRPEQLRNFTFYGSWPATIMPGNEKSIQVNYNVSTSLGGTSYIKVFSNALNSNPHQITIFATNETTDEDPMFKSRVLNISKIPPFGEVKIGKSYTYDFTISNPSEKGFEIYGITYPAGFTGPNWKGMLNSNQTVKLAVTFRPTEAKYYGGLIIADQGISTCYGTKTSIVSGTGVL